MKAKVIERAFDMRECEGFAIATGVVIVTTDDEVFEFGYEADFDLEDASFDYEIGEQYGTHKEFEPVLIDVELSETEDVPPQVVAAAQKAVEGKYE